MVVLNSHPSSSISLYHSIFLKTLWKASPLARTSSAQKLTYGHGTWHVFSQPQAEYQRIRPFRISDSFQRELSPCLTSLRDVKSHKCFSRHSQVFLRMHELFPAQSVLHILMRLRTLYMHMFHLNKDTLMEFFRFSSVAVVLFMLLTD